MSDSNGPESLFNESKRNEYSLTNESDEEAIDKIADAADFIVSFMRVNKAVPCGKKTYAIKDQKYQAVSYKFELTPDNAGSCELSTPASFSGDVQMWVTNGKGNKVWASVYDLDNVDFDGRALFEYLGGEDPNVYYQVATTRRSIARFFGDEEGSNDSTSSNSDEETQLFEPDDDLPF